VASIGLIPSDVDTVFAAVANCISSPEKPENVLQESRIGDAGIDPSPRSLV
jgi:hypothetical protein